MAPGTLCLDLGGQMIALGIIFAAIIAAVLICIVKVGNAPGLQGWKSADPVDCGTREGGK